VLLDAIATFILAGMMLIPLVNIGVGAIVGAVLGGVPGAFMGILAAIAITAVEQFIADRLRMGVAPEQTDRNPETVTTEPPVITAGRRASRATRQLVRTVRTQPPRTAPPRQRSRAHRLREARERTLHAAAVHEKRNGATH